MSFNRKKAASLFDDSFIIKFSKKCYDALLSGFFGSLATGYSKKQEAFEKSAVGTSDGSIGSWRDTSFSRFRRGAIVSYENSRILSSLSVFRDMLLSFKLRFYGFFAVYFGICVLLVNFIEDFSVYSGLSIDAGVMVGIGFIGASVPLLFSQRTLARAMCESLLVSKILFDLLGLSRANLKRVEKSGYGGGKYFVAALSGAALGLCAYFISAAYILVGLAALLCAVMVYKSPEIGVAAAVLTAPFLGFIGSPTILLSALVLYTFVCMCIKLFLGKLSFKLEICDIFILLFGGIMLLGGVVTAGGAASFKEAAMYGVLILIYFMIVLLVRDGEWLHRIEAALIMSGTLTALYGLYQKVSGNLETDTVDKEMFEDITGRITSTFGTSNMLGVFIIMVFPFALSSLLSSKKLFGRLAALFSCAVMGLCMIYTWSRGAWLGLAIACAVFLVLYNHYILPVLIPAALAAVTLLWDKLGGGSFAASLGNRLASIVTMSDSSSLYRLSIWRGSLGALSENIWTGVGVGTEAFRSVYVRFAESGIVKAPHSHNLYLQIALELGIVGFAVFVCAMVLTFMSGLENVRRSSVAVTSAEKAAAVAGISGLVGAMAQGVTDFIWYNYRVYFFFWVLAALITASSRIARKKLARRDEQNGD